MQEITTQVQLTNGQIAFNFEEVKEYILGTLEEYKGAVFSGEESIKYAKTIVADLRKSQAALKSEVTEYKKAYMEPFEAFKKQADEIIALYNEPITLIDGQVKAYAEQLKEEKRKVIEEIYNQEFTEELKEHFKLENIYNPRWENAIYKKLDVIRDMKEIVAKINEDLTIIQTYRSESVDKALLMYYQDRSLAAALQYMQHYEQQRQEIEERRRAREEQRIREEERAKIEAEKKQAEEIEKAKAEAIEAYIPQDEGEPEEELIYNIKLTPQARESLEMYMDSIGLEWEVLNG